MTADVVPAGFRRSESGLILPEEHSRVREVWTHSEWRTLERATKLLESRGLKLFFRCEHSKDCQREPIERRRNLDGTITLRCAHADRVMSRL